MKKRQDRVKENGADYKHWGHPGGKLLAEGAEALTDTELLAMIISSGIPGKSAEEIADEIINKYGSFKGIANQPLEKFYSIKGLKKVKVMRIAAAFEIARRVVNQVMKAK